MPKTRTEYWASKFEKNVNKFTRDKEKLQSLGWRVLVVWECELKEKNIMIEKVKGVINNILQN